MGLFLLYVIIYVILGVIWGCGVQAVIDNKGYKENWFWWGFFFGVWALIFALTKPDVYSGKYTYVDTPLTRASDEEEREKEIARQKKVLEDGGWKCICGTINASYVGSCYCGQTKESSLRKIQEREIARQQTQNNRILEAKKKSESDNLDNIKKLKELLDMDAITEEEYELKKKELLNL